MAYASNMSGHWVQDARPSGLRASGDLREPHVAPLAVAPKSSPYHPGHPSAPLQLPRYWDPRWDGWIDIAKKTGFPKEYLPIPWK